MTEFFNETLKYYFKITNIFFDKDDNSYRNTIKAIEGEIQHFEFAANRVADSSLRETLYEFVALHISTALEALQKVSELQNPVSGRELNDAFQPYKRMATDLIVRIENLSNEILAFLNQLAAIQKDDLEKITHPLKEIKAKPSIDELKGVDPTLDVMSKYVQRLQDDALVYHDVITTIIDALPKQIDLEMKIMKSGIIADLERVKLDKLESIEKKWNLIESIVSTTPAFAGYVIDKILEANNLPTIATEIGLASSTVDKFILDDHFEKKMDSELERYRVGTALILTIFIIPSAALYAGRLQAAYKFIADTLIAEYEKRNK